MQEMILFVTNWVHFLYEKNSHDSQWVFVKYPLGITWQKGLALY